MFKGGVCCNRLQKTTTQNRAERATVVHGKPYVQSHEGVEVKKKLPHAFCGSRQLTATKPMSSKKKKEGEEEKRTVPRR